MRGGVTGRLLQVDLTSGEIAAEPLADDLAIDYIGGDNMASRIIYDRVPPGTLVFEPGNCLAFLVGPLGGTGVPSDCNHTVAALSAGTGYTVGVSHVNGAFGPRLKLAGYDGVIVSGRSAEPVYLYVDNGRPELRDARHLWGMDTRRTTDTIKSELGVQGVSVDCIGPAGENLCRMACIVSDKTQVAARGGLGAVMGAKNLKAIAVKGNQKPLISEPEEFKRYAEEWKTANLTNPEMQLYIKYGTAGILGNMHSLGDLPIMNFSRGVFPGYEKITGQHLVDNFLCKNLTCRGCWVAHRKLLEINEGGKVLRAELPEYEDLAAWGSNIGLADPARVVELAELADSLGIDALDGSNVVALAMECYEKGILTKEDTGGTDLRFGNAEAAAEIMQCIAYRKGLGNVLAEGPGRAAKIIGRGATEICAHIKNMSPIMHDFRAFWGFALQYTVATGGPTHEGGPRALEQTGVLPRFSTQGKAAAVKQGQEVRCFINSLGVCLFGAIGVPIEVLTGALSAALGYQFTADEVKKTVLRAVNLRRAFAVRRGLLPDDDTLSPRLLEAPMEGGAKGSKIDIVPMVREYYDLMGWDEKTGKPSRKTLADLGLEDIIDDIW